MIKSKMHLVPQVIIDVAESIKDNGNPNSREMYMARIEAIRDFCEYVIAREKSAKSISAVKRK